MSFSPSLGRALPFWASLTLIPLAVVGVVYGGWAVFLVPFGAWGMFSVLDLVAGLDKANPDIDTPVEDLFWYRFVTWIWPPLQIVTVFWAIAYLVHSDHALWEILLATYGLGIMAGTVGIVYAHELMHQPSRLERWLGDILMASVFYGHFRSEHLLVHHTYVGTPRDAVTARYNEGFHRFYFRVLRQCPGSAWQAEANRLGRTGRPVWSRSNPFWRYGLLQISFLALAWFIGGALGVGLFALQAGVAIWQLELINYIEHYGLTRRHLGEGKYEHVKLQHSWNATHRASNRLLINLMRHSDHHGTPSRRFPLLQTYRSDEAPELPYGYGVMGALAMIPPLWRRRMNPRVRAWRRRYYPDIEDWTSYADGSLPRPR